VHHLASSISRMVVYGEHVHASHLHLSDTQ